MNTDKKSIIQTDASASTTENAVVLTDGELDDLLTMGPLDSEIKLPIKAAVRQGSEEVEKLDEDMLLSSQEPPKCLEHEDGDSELETPESDLRSICSDRSGVTVLGEGLDKMAVRTGLPFVKMTSAEKRRFKRALADGLSRDEALEKAKTPPDARELSKRALSDDAGAPAGKKPKRNEDSAVSSKPMYSHILGMVKLGFVTDDVSINPLTDEQLVTLQEAIIDTTIDHGDGFQPEFEGCFPRSGWLMVACTNRNTADWLKAHQTSVREKSKLEVNIVEEVEFPRSHFVRGYFPHSLDLPNEKILASIAVQNSMDAKKWRVIMRKTDGQLVHLLMAVDDNSWAKLVGANGRIAYRFSHLKLMLKDVGKERAAGKQQVTKAAPAVTEKKGSGRLDEGPSTSKAAVESAPVKAVSTSRGSTDSTKVPKSGGRPDEPREPRDKGPRRARLQRLAAVSLKNSGT